MMIRPSLYDDQIKHSHEFGSIIIINFVLMITAFKRSHQNHDAYDDHHQGYNYEDLYITGSEYLQYIVVKVTQLLENQNCQIDHSKGELV